MYVTWFSRIYFPRRVSVVGNSTNISCQVKIVHGPLGDHRATRSLGQIARPKSPMSSILPCRKCVLTEMTRYLVSHQHKRKLTATPLCGWRNFKRYIAPRIRERAHTHGHERAVARKGFHSHHGSHRKVLYLIAMKCDDLSSGNGSLA